MENFDWSSFTRKIAIRATLSEIYNAWSKATEIEKWFLSDAAFFRNKEMLDKEIPVAQGDSYQWKWFLYDDLENGTITQANGKDYIQFTFAGNCLVDIKLSETNDYVVVELTQKNIPLDESSKRDIRLGCHTGWSFYLVNLKSVYEGGLDLRNKDVALPPMTNN